MQISDLYTLYKKHPVVTTDSRDCPSDALFFALKGASFDGNAYAKDALQAGCAYAIVDDASVATDNYIIYVDDVLVALQQLARLHRQTLGIPVIGITGTNGKTTTKELTSAVLSQKHKTLATQGNLNNHIGVPLTLLKLTREHEIAIIEMGANHPGEIRNLANIALPDYGIITNVGYAHLEGFGSLEGVIRTKGELYEFLKNNGGKIFIHHNNPTLINISEGLEKISYGQIEDENGARPCISGKMLRNHPFLALVWKHHGMPYTVETQLVGDYNLSNVLAAITIGVYFGCSPEQINNAISHYEPTNNRSQLKKTIHNELIIDAYNANPSSMRAALENFTSMNVAPKAVILGDMLELGDKSQELHTEILNLLKTLNIEKILLCGEHFTRAITSPQYLGVCNTPLPSPASPVSNAHISPFPTIEAISIYLDSHPLKGYHILIKGSRGIHLEQLIPNL